MAAALDDAEVRFAAACGVVSFQQATKVGVGVKLRVFWHAAADRAAAGCGWPVP